MRNHPFEKTMRGIYLPTLAIALTLGSGSGCDSERPSPFDSDGDTDSDGNSDGTGGFGFPNDGPYDGQGPMGNPQYQPNFIQRGRPPGPPERGYTAIEGERAGSGEGELCAVCADSGDCAAGACVVHMDTGETFCGAECGTDLDCPEPQEQECVDVAETTTRQCVPRLGSCFEFDPGAEPINPINEPPAGLGEGGAAGSGNSGSN